MKFNQYIPYCDPDYKPVSFEFSTIEELLAHPLFQRLKAIKDFSHFAIDESYIMTICDGGRKYVAGFVDEPDFIDLPKWRIE
jgi:hypothetical protein